MRIRVLFCVVVAIALCSGCADTYSKNVQKGNTGDKMTLGTVQREIRIGMTNAQVVEALGSPNIVTTDEQRREVWVYDKFATDVSAAGGGVWLILGAVQAGASSTSQRTITVIIKFDEYQKVRDFAYHTSRF